MTSLNPWSKSVSIALILYLFTDHSAVFAQTVEKMSIRSAHGKQGEIEFHVGSSLSTVISGARVIVINHDGSIVATGLTDARGKWFASVPYFKVDWNERFTMKGMVNAIIMANGYNEQALFVVPITEHTIQPVVLQPIVANGRNLPSQALGNIYHQDLRLYIDRYANELKLVKQPPIPGDFHYAPWSPATKVSGGKRP